MGLFSAIFGRKNRLQNNGKPIRIPSPPPVTVAKVYPAAEAAGDVGITSVPHPFKREPIIGVFPGYRDTLDRAYFSVEDSDISHLARWAAEVERSLGDQGFLYRPESGDCDDRADFIFALRRFFPRDDATWFVVKISVLQERAALGVPAGGGHQLLAVRGSSQWWVIEPATGDYCPLREYPNRHRIRRQYMH